MNEIPILKCDCGEIAEIWARWGFDDCACGCGKKAPPPCSGNLCKNHVEQLWKELEPSLKTNHAWIEFDKPKLI